MMVSLIILFTIPRVKKFMPWEKDGPLKTVPGMVQHPSGCLLKNRECLPRAFTGWALKQLFRVYVQLTIINTIQSFQWLNVSAPFTHGWHYLKRSDHT